MWSEICELVPSITGLDSFVEHDIEVMQNCIAANKIKGNDTEIYEERLRKIKQRKRELDNMHPFKRWLHCEKQFRKVQRKRQKVINDCKRRLYG